MTVPATTDDASFPGTGSAGPFTYTFKIYADTELTVFKVENSTSIQTDLTLTTDYTITTGSVGSDAGSITLTAVLAVGHTLYIIRNPAFIQGASFRIERSLDAATLENAFDKATMRDLAIKRTADAGIKIPAFEDPEDVSIEVPSVADRAGRPFIWASDGSPGVGALVDISSITSAGFVAFVDSVSTLKGLSAPSSSVTYYLRGYYSIGDGGGGFFRWNSADTSTDNGGTILQRTAGGTGRWNRIHDGQLSIRWFGAKGDGSTNDTSAVQACLTAGATGGYPVYVPKGSFKVTTVRVYNGLPAFYGPGTIVDSGVSGAGVVVLDGPNALSGTAVSDCYISLTITMSSGASYGIWCDKALNCIFDRCHISGFTDSNDENGIRFSVGSTGNTVRDCKVIFSTSSPTHGQTGIVFVADTTSYGGYFSGSGVTTDAAHPCSQNTIRGNYIYKGSHGISGNGLEHSSIVGNMLDGQRDRSIILEPVCNFNTVSGNTCKNFGSSGVTMGYGGRYNAIVGNTCYAPSAGGEAALQMYVGPSYNLIANNTVNANTNYGVYVAVNATNNKIYGNLLYGYRLCGIALECDWESPLPGGAAYSRPNFGASPSGQWAYSNSQSNEIKGNTLFDPAGGTQCGIYLGQLLANGNLNDNEVSGNKIQSTALTHYLMVFEETSGRAINNKLTGNTFLSFSASKVSFTRSIRSHFNLVEGNEGINIGSTSDISFADADATPDVSIGSLFTCANTGATNITNFDGGGEAQDILVRLDVNTTIKYDATKIRLKGAVDATGNSNSFMRFKLLGGIWFEVSRNF